MSSSSSTRRSRRGSRGRGSQPARCGDARRHPRTRSADAAVLCLREGVPRAPSGVRRPDRRLEQSYIQSRMRRLLLPLLALALPARRRGDDAAGPARHRRAGRPEGLPDRTGEGPPAEGLAEVAAAGVNVLKVGPAGEWTTADLARTIAENRAAAAHGLDLGEPERVRAAAAGPVARVAAAPRGRHARGRSVSQRDRAGRARTSLALPDAPAVAPFRVLPCDRQATFLVRGHAPVDTGRLWVTVQAPRAGVWSAPYSEVTDIHGVNSYPIAIGDPDPDLGEPGSWTNVLGLATPRRSVWTTLGICWTWSYDAAGTSSCRRGSSSASWSTTRS